MNISISLIALVGAFLVWNLTKKDSALSQVLGELQKQPFVKNLTDDVKEELIKEALKITGYYFAINFVVKKF